MENKLTGKKILIVNGSVLADAELRDALVRLGAKVTVTKNMVSAFDLIARRDFNGAVIDHGLHNEAFDLCTELQALDIPYISANVPHRLQGLEARERDADATAERLANLIELEAFSVHDGNCVDYVLLNEIPPELRAL
jgi:DNA-binding response OmpR family regulator